MGRDREDKPDYKVKHRLRPSASPIRCSCWNTTTTPRGWSTAAARNSAVRTAFVYHIDNYLKDKNLYKKGESAITFQDVQDCLVMSRPASPPAPATRTRPKRPSPINLSRRRMTDFLKHHLQVYFLEKPEEAQKICQAGAGQQAEPRARGKDAPEHQKEALRPRSTSPTACRSSWTAAPRTRPAASCISWRATPLWARSSLSRDSGVFRPSCPSAARF